MKKIKIVLVIMAAGVILTSCMKNKFDNINPSRSFSVVEFKNPGFPSSETPAGAPYTVFASNLAIAASVEAVYQVQWTGPDPVSEDVSVDVGIKSAAVTELNASRSGVSTFVPYVELPAALYTINTPKVTIRAGARTADVQVTFNTAGFDLTKKYAMPISITSTNRGNVSANFGTILIRPVAK